MIMIDSSVKAEHIPEYDEQIVCDEHPLEPVFFGYGLAGGGMGPYTLCNICCKVLTKSCEPVDDDQ